MKISSKGRYGLAALASMAKSEGVGNIVSVVGLSERLDISKIYLEQVFAILKRGGFVTAVKGPSGGYYLAKQPKDITAYDVLSAFEVAMFEKTQVTIPKRDENLERSINENVYAALDEAIKKSLSDVTLEEIVSKSGEEIMYYL
ncbi:MAG: Rrf2 family transcriptional regulator [Defluviitaleaceae bacterium]|nr:Rrf2 family transcriptional regulator [Defluviitaleaceae bacterium]